MPHISASSTLLISSSLKGSNSKYKQIGLYLISFDYKSSILMWQTKGENSINQLVPTFSRITLNFCGVILLSMPLKVLSKSLCVLSSSLAFSSLALSPGFQAFSALCNTDGYYNAPRTQTTNTSNPILYMYECEWMKCD